MKGRKEHVITRIKGDAQPARLVALGVTVRVNGVPLEPGHQIETLVGLSAYGWARTAEGVYRPWSKWYGSADTWWRDVPQAARRGGTTWIVASRMVRLASLLGLWERIDNGSVQWHGGASAGAHRPVPDGDVRPVRGHARAGDADGADQSGVGLPSVPDLLPPRGGANRDAPRVAPPAPSGVVIDDPPTVLRVRLPGLPGRLLLCDSRNWGVDVPPGCASAEDEARYLSGAMRGMVDTLARNGWGGLKATAGSQALATWRRAYMTHRVVAHNDDEVLALEEAAYVGGRCEAGRLGRVCGPLVSIDRRSAYAHACASWAVPVGIERRLDGDLSSLRQDPSLAGRAIAEVHLETDEPAYPVASAAGVIYPVGRISTTLAGPELSDALRHGRVRRVGRAVLYHCEPALKAYAEALWRERQDAQTVGDDPRADWLKKLLVSLPGKLGQRVASWEPAPLVRPRRPWHSWWHYSLDRQLTRLRALGGAVQRQGKRGWTWDAVPAMACWILSAARVALLGAIRAAGWSECVYWDTDSLLMTCGGWTSFRAAPHMVGSGLGAWRVVRRVTSAVIHGVKHYEHDGVTTCAGAPRLDTQDTRLHDRYWYRETFGVALSQGHAPGAARTLRRYTRPSGYRLGRVGDGGRVYPFVKEMW